jgi:hypothetical protein
MLVLGAVKGVHIWSNISRGEFKHVAPLVGVLDD